MTPNVIPFQTFTEAGTTYKVAPNKDLEIDAAELAVALQEQPAKFAWYASLYEYAKHRLRMAGKTVERVRADCIKDAWARGEKYKQKWEIDILLNTSEEVRNAEDEVERWEFRVGKLGKIVEAFRIRKDMLQSIGANMRREMAQED